MKTFTPVLLFLLLWYSKVTLLCVGEPLLFESAGKMASSLSYLHTQIPVNLSAIEDKLIEYKERLIFEFSEDKVFQKYVEYCKEEGIGNPNKSTFHVHPLYQWAAVARAHLFEVTQIESDLEALFTILPQIPNKTDRLLAPEIHDYYSHLIRQYNRGNVYKIPDRLTPPISGPPPKRRKRFAPAIAAAAIFIPGLIGTVMGIINHQKINALFDITSRHSQLFLELGRIVF